MGRYSIAELGKRDIRESVSQEKGWGNNSDWAFFKWEKLVTRE